MQTRLSIVKKMVIGITAASAVTYGTSAFFLLALKDSFSFMPSWLFVLLTLLVGVFWTGLFGFAAARWLLRPLLALTAAAKEAAAGNLAVKIDTRRSGDELQALGDAFSSMLAQFRTIIEGIKDNSHMADVHAKELQEAVGHATNQIEQMTNESEVITSGTTSQAESAERLYVDAETLSGEANRMTEEAEDARGRAQRMNGAAKQSEEVFQSLVGGMRRLSALNRDALEVVKQLDSYANEIGTISNVVGDLADQTHFLALNASIEAARAGEEGRGFQVVAQAVKSLADESAGSVKSIRALIARIQQEIARAVDHIRAQHEVSEQEATQGERYAGVFEEVARDSKLVVEIVESMAERISFQAGQAIERLSESRKVASVADQIRQGAKHVFAASQEQTAVMEEIAASTDGLRAKSSELRSKTEFFKI
ncbi:methyl-accepting chemotaxis protein [Cohnella soli]|uniref:Methyl-accepting chemotaxis protein n=1 Tax=Cohnella soli TaxID=425005 RepID=A0ABW0HUQ3_9BACL